MPTYQYTCTDCGTPLEAVQSFSDAALTTCPTCGGRLRKVFSAVGVVFKGSGFYRTDSRDGAKTKSGKVDAGVSAGADASSGKGEGKPAKDASSGSETKSTDTAAAKPAASGDTSSKPSAAKKPSSSSSAA